MKIATLKIAFFLLAISFTNCSKDETPLPPLQQLPPMTQVGANTVGCLVNGEIFLPHQDNLFGPPSTTCFYQLIDGKYEFGLRFFNDQQKIVRQVIVGTNKLEFTEGQTYLIKAEEAEESTYGYYTLGGNQYGYGTDNTFTGELTITKLDPSKAIISGTFWFDAKRANTEEVIKIRDGRFDMQYSQ